MEYMFRSPRPDDLPAVAELVREVEAADYGEAEDPTERLGVGFRLIDRERDAWVVEDGEGRIVAGGMVRVRHPTRLRSFGLVRPAHTGRGLGSELLRRIERRGRELARQAPEGETVYLGQEVGPLNPRARELLERNGYELARHFWKMGIDLAAEPPEPAWPEGIRVETMQPGQEREVFDASEEAFQDHWDHQPHDYDEWRAWMQVESFDPSLWLIARDDAEIAGISLCSVARQDGEGWVGVLGVRRPWRRRGLGKALLLESFRRLRERGLPRAVLGVDAANPTGATRLYEGAGMSVVFESASYRKDLTDRSIEC
jgi:mycothiol synthase